MVLARCESIDEGAAFDRTLTLFLIVWLKGGGGCLAETAIRNWLMAALVKLGSCSFLDRWCFLLCLWSVLARIVALPTPTPVCVTARHAHISANPKKILLTSVTAFERDETKRGFRPKHFHSPDDSMVLICSQYGLQPYRNKDFDCTNEHSS